MARLLDGKPLTERTLVDQWTQLAGVSSLLGCAERTGIRIGIWGGVVRNFVLDDRALFDGEQSLHLFDFIDPFSDIDCVVDRADDWPLVLQSISSSVAFAGFVRWEVQTRAEALSRADRYQSVGAESFIVWHEGFDEKGHSRISLDPVRGQVDALLETPARRTGHGKAIGDDVWQDLLDSLRMARYSFEFPQEPYAEHETSHPDRGRLETLARTPEAQGLPTENMLRFEIAMLDLLLTARRLPPAIDYLRSLTETIPSALVRQSRILLSILERWRPSVSYLGGLLYRQRNSPGIRLRLRMREEENLSRGGFRSIVPWTSLWSLTPGEDCCRHEDFRNGVAVASWRALNPNVTYTQAQAQEFAPVAQVIANTPYEEPPVVANLARGKLVPIPGIVRIGAALTLRFDHAYLAHLLGRNVRTSIGIADPETLQ